MLTMTQRNMKALLRSTILHHLADHPDDFDEREWMWMAFFDLRAME
jgi:hypothetical protein